MVTMHMQYSLQEHTRIHVVCGRGRRRGGEEEGRREMMRKEVPIEDRNTAVVREDIEDGGYKRGEIEDEGYMRD